jgi:hypothetical protein
MNFQKNRASLAVALALAVLLFMYIKPNKTESYKSCGCGK